MTHQALKKTRGYGPDVLLVRRDTGLVVEKTYRKKALPVRLLGCVLVAWERFIYGKLTGIEGIPEVIREADRYTLVTRFMGGTNLRDERAAPSQAYFEELRSLISLMHKRGVIHLDLRNRRNYGIDDEGRPYLVDFATCLYIPWDGRARRWLAAIDWMGFVKVKHKTYPGSVEEGERALLALGAGLSSLWLPMRIVGLLKRIGKRFARHS